MSLGFDALKESMSCAQLLKRPKVTLSILEKMDSFQIDEEFLEVSAIAENDIKYEGFLRKQDATIERAKRLESYKLPDDINYEEIPGLLAESKEKLSSVRPLTIGQASRISGVTPADVAVLLVYLQL